jgi:hypothetical protein
MKNLLFHLKAVKTGTHKAKVGAGAGAETNSFGPQHWIRLFDRDLNPYCRKEVINLKRYFLYILTGFSLSVGLQGPNQKAYLVKFFLPVNFVNSFE